MRPMCRFDQYMNKILTKEAYLVLSQSYRTKLMKKKGLKEVLMQQRESSIDGGAFYTNKKNKNKKEEKEEKDNRHPVHASFSFTYNSYKQFPKKKED